MLPVLTAAEMRAADRRTIEEIGLPRVVLMENAGGAVARRIRERFPRPRRVAAICGKGNNGGDGFVVARNLIDRTPEVYLVGTRGELGGDAALHLAAYERSGGRISEVSDQGAWERMREEVLAAEVVVDALLGTGLREQPRGLIARVIEDLAAQCDPARVVAVDLPSGLSSDTGEATWPSVVAGLTVTFAAPKHGHVLSPACDRVGELVVADIGIPRFVLDQAGPALWLLEAEDARVAFSERAPGGHKGTYGHVLIVAGSVGKTGAAVLAATAALRGGAGLVTVATPAPALPLVAVGRAEVMTEPLPVAADGTLTPEAAARALAVAERCDAVVLGPGLGQEEETQAFVRELVARCPVPLVVDADGLNALARAPDSAWRLRRSAGTIVTPHPGEMARLVGSSTAVVQQTRLETARAFASASGAMVVLKGRRSVVAEPSGRAAVNPTGNPGMATAGTGDALAGVLGALLARGLDPWRASTAGVYIHGLAGDRAAKRLGQESMLAGDLIESLSEAIRHVQAPSPVDQEGGPFSKG